jgi:hypothetical protein
MALAAPYNGSANTLQANAAFIPQIWETELKKELDANFVLTQASTMVNFMGKKGDTIKIPLIKRMGVFDKLPETQVRLQSFPGENFEMKVDKYKEVSFMIEDILDLQANFSMRVPYISEAAYAMARDIDNSLLGLRASIPTTQQIVASSTGTIAGDPTPLDDAAVRAAMQRLDEANVPQRDRHWIVAVGQYTDLLGITKFTSRDFINGAPTTTGVIGTLYGIPVIATTQIGANTLDGYINGEGAIGEPTPGVVGSPYLPTQDTPVGLVSGGLPRGKTGAEVASPFATCMLVQKDWARYAMQKTPSSEMSRENLYQADVLVNTQVYGMRVYRTDHCVLIHTAP